MAQEGERGPFIPISSFARVSQQEHPTRGLTGEHCPGEGSGYACLPVGVLGECKGCGVGKLVIALRWVSFGGGQREAGFC